MENLCAKLEELDFVFHLLKHGTVSLAVSASRPESSQRGNESQTRKTSGMGKNC